MPDNLGPSIGSGAPIKSKVAYAKILFLRDREKFKDQPVFTTNLRGSDSQEGVYDHAIYYFFTLFGNNKPNHYVWQFSSAEGWIDNVLQLYPFDPSKFYADPSMQYNPRIYDKLVIPKTDGVVVVAHYFNGFQRDRGEWAGIRAEKDVEELRLVVDFSSVITAPDKSLFKEEPTAYLSDRAQRIEKMVTPLEYNTGKIFVASQKDVAEGSVLKFKWKINWDDLATWQAMTEDKKQTTPLIDHHPRRFQPQTPRNSKLPITDFEIIIDPNGSMRSRVSGAEVRGKLDLRDLKNLQEHFDKIVAKGYRTSNRAMIKLGEKMYECLFPSAKENGARVSIHDDFSYHYRNALEGKSRLRLWLRIDNIDAQSIPWELVHHNDSFLVSDNKVSIVRLPTSTAEEARILPKEVNDKLRILVIVSSPKDNPLKYAKKELDEVRRIWTERLGSSNIDFDILSTDPAAQKKPTPYNVQDSISKSPNIIHYIGHSGFDSKGKIALSKENGSTKLIDEVAFANLFNHQNVMNLALVVLNSCESGSERGFNGIARRLVERGVPTVVAMRYSILDRVQPKFASVFYEKLIDFGYAVESALIDCRHKSFLDWASNKIEFAAPVLYLASDDSKGVVLSFRKIRDQETDGG